MYVHESPVMTLTMRYGDIFNISFFVCLFQCLSSTTDCLCQPIDYMKLLHFTPSTDTVDDDMPNK
eukprot:gene11812-8123_t